MFTCGDAIVVHVCVFVVEVVIVDQNPRKDCEQYADQPTELGCILFFCFEGLGLDVNEQENQVNEKCSRELCCGARFDEDDY